MSYRPRGTLARTLYDKIHNDQYLEGYDMRLVRIHISHIGLHAYLLNEELTNLIDLID